MTERFELVEIVGQGSMGIVWRARDTTTEEVVAVKVLRGAHVLDPEYVRRFAQEVELARRVRSPNVVRVLGYGARKGVPFVVLEYVPGRSLRQRIVEQGSCHPVEARSVLAQVATGLAAVHHAGVLHRDVKASNVLLGTGEVAKLTDFGISRERDVTGHTAFGTLLGTPAYMAPEGPLDARSDLYSLGVVYYEMLAGVVPFEGTNYQDVIVAHIRQPPDLRRIPIAERDLAGWLLEKDPVHRPQRAEELLAALARTGPPRASQTPARTPPDLHAGAARPAEKIGPLPGIPEGADRRRTGQSTARVSPSGGIAGPLAAVALIGLLTGGMVFASGATPGGAIMLVGIVAVAGVATTIVGMNRRRRT